MSTILKAENLTIGYGKFQVLHDVSFEVEQGKVLGIIGPNGAGKTTLLNALIGLIIPTQGTITFEGRDITKVHPAKRCNMGIGRTYQVPRPFENMTVFENMLVGAVHGAGKSEKASKEKCLEILNEIGLYEKRNTLAGQLALLERKHMEIARALATEPRLLLLDEVGAGLTEVEIGEMIELVVSLKETGLTMIWIEHIMKAMIEGADNLMCLAAGIKLMQGDPMEVLNSKEVEAVYLGAEEEQEEAKSA
jgi:branched-chain amino acid transport system ATP-binding protein